MRKKLAMLGLVVLITTFAVGCEEQAPVPASMTTKMTAVDLLGDSRLAMENVKSYEATFRVDTKMAMEGEEIRVVSEGDLRQMVPEKKMDMKVRAMFGGDENPSLGSELKPMEMRILTEPVEERRYAFYLQAMGTWLRGELSEEDLEAENMNTTQQVAEIFADNDSRLVLNDEKVTLDGKEVYVMEGRASAKAINSLFNSNNPSGGEVEYTEESDAELYATFDAQTKLPVEMKISLIGAKVKSAETSDEMAMDMITTIRYTGFDTVDSIEIPEEAKNAAEMPKFGL